jgi:hypothetical protein
MYSVYSLDQVIHHLKYSAKVTGNSVGMLEYAKAMVSAGDEAGDVNAVVAAAFSAIKDDSTRFAAVKVLLGDDDEL